MIILESSVGTMKNTMNGYIDAFLLKILCKHISIHYPVNPEILQSLELSKTFQKITQDENSSIPYFKQMIPYSDEEYLIEPDEPKFPYPQPRLTCCTGISGISYYYFYHHKISLCDNFPGYQFALSRDRTGSIRKTFHNW